jgi:DNA-binding transcriptional ArsR family regulator
VGPDLAAIGALIANPARATILLSLIGGEARPSGELSKLARVAPSTGSEHLGALVAGRLLKVEGSGRNRYYSLAGPTVADALEALALVSPRAIVGGLRQAMAADRMRFARTCYDHLAGTLGVAVLDGLRSSGWMEMRDGNCTLTTTGELGLVQLGVDVDGARRSRRAFARLCLDWTERRHHLAGALGAAMTRTMLDRGWILPVGQGRSLELSQSGQSGLATFGVRDL